MNKRKNTCWDCSCVIPSERLDFLYESGTHPDRLTCIKHSHTTRIKGIYSGEHGTSDIILCDKVYDDSVRSKFREIEETTEEAAEDVDD